VEELDPPKVLGDLLESLAVLLTTDNCICYQNCNCFKMWH